MLRRDTDHLTVVREQGVGTSGQGGGNNHGFGEFQDAFPANIGGQTRGVDINVDDLQQFRIATAAKTESNLSGGPNLAG